MAERTESVVLDFEVDLGASVESIEKLTKANKELREERKKLNLDTADGQKRVKEINAQLDSNTSKITANTSAIEKQRANIGNYKSALDGVHPALGKVGEGLEAGASGFKAMARSALAFIATPIGAVIAALVAVFTLLKSALSQNDALMDKFENVTNAVGVVLDVVVSRVGKLGEALIALASGNFSEAINLTSQAFSGLADEIENAVKQQQLYLDASRKLEDAQIALSIQAAKSENEIKRLVVAAKNRNLTFDEQEKLLRKSLSLEEDLVRTRSDLARQELVIAARTLRSDKEFQQQSSENFEQYLQRLLDSEKLSGDEKKILSDKLVALETARGSSLAFQEKVENSLAAVQEKRAAALEKQNKALEEQQALNRADRRSDTSEEVDPGPDPLIDAFKTQLDGFEKFGDNRLRIEGRIEDESKKRKQKAADEDVDRANKVADMRIQAERQAAADIGSILGSVGSMFAEESVEHKVLASAQALINTYLAATAALASGSEINPIFGIISAAAAIASGLASVAKINGVEFAEGGWTGPGHKMQAVGVVHADEYVVPKRIVNNPMARSSIANLESMRLKPYADGGLVSNSIAQPVNQQMDIANILKNMPAPVVSVKEINTLQKRVQVKQNLSKR